MQSVDLKSSGQDSACFSGSLRKEAVECCQERAILSRCVQDQLSARSTLTSLAGGCLGLGPFGVHYQIESVSEAKAIVMNIAQSKETAHN